MMNNTKQVSLGNEVDFSYIRKAKEGVKIPKLLDGGIPQWYLDLYGQNASLSGWNSSLNSSHAGDTIVGQGNSSLHGTAGDLNTAWAANKAYTENSLRVGQDIQAWYNQWVTEHPNATPEQMVTAYNQIAQSIRDYQAQKHSYNSSGASGNNRAFKSMFSSRSLKTDPNADMSQDAAFIGYQDSEDDIYGSSSFLRRMDRYEKEYDQLTDEEKAARTHTIRIGDKDIKVYKKANGDIGLLPTLSGTTPEEPTSDGTIPGEATGNSDDKNRKTWRDIKYQAAELPQRKFRFPTFPLYNAALLGIGNITNKRILDTKLKAPSMRYMAPTLQGKVTDAYAERSGNLQSLQEQNWKTKQQINNTSDLGTAQKADRDLRSQELTVLMQNNKAKQNEFNQTSLNLQNISNTNKLNWTNVANQNRQAWVAESRDRLNTIAQYQAQLGQNLQENIMSNYTDWKAWNRNNLLEDYSDWRVRELAKVQNDIATARQNLENALKLENYQGYKDFWKGLLKKDLTNGNMIPVDPENKFATNYLNAFGANDTAENRLTFFLNNYKNDEYKNILGGFEEGWKKYLNDSQAKYVHDTNLINTKWETTDSRNKPTYVNGEISSWLYNILNPKTNYESIYSYAKGGRFAEYLKHNRRAEKDIRDATLKTMHDSRKMLARDLDALDRESLLLLRAIFK